MDHDGITTQPPHAAALTIGDLAERTGLSPAVLRMWETRYGFPEPTRLSSGHRRYSDNDVELVQQALRRKEAGLRLEIALAEAAATRPPRSPSVFAELRRRHPGLAVQRLRKSTLIALSWAIEDECCAKADSPVLFGAFQRGDFYEPSAARWNELARVSRSAIVFADRWAGSPGEGPLRVELDENAPLRREWAVICDADDATACLTAWELPGQVGTPDRQRLFETIWTVDPVAVRDAARIAASVAVSAGASSAQMLLDELADAPRPMTFSPSGVTALLNRVVAYVDGLS